MLHKNLIKLMYALIGILMLNFSGFAQTELLLNNEFDDSTNNWEIWEGNGTTGTLDLDNTSQLSGVNSGKVTLTAVGGGQDWELALAQALPNGVSTSNQYHLTFMAKATTNVDINFVIQEVNSPWGALYQDTFSITTTSQTFDVTFTPTGSGAANFVFSLGAIGLNTQIWFDNIHLTENTTAVGELQLPSLQVYPNPATDFLNVDFNLPNDSLMAWKILDPTGKTVYVHKNENMKQGTQHLRMNTGNLSAGIYFLILQNNQRQKTIRFLVK